MLVFKFCLLFGKSSQNLEPSVDIFAVHFFLLHRFYHFDAKYHYTSDGCLNTSVQHHQARMMHSSSQTADVENSGAVIGDVGLFLCATSIKQG